MDGPVALVEGANGYEVRVHLIRTGQSRAWHLTEWLQTTAVDFLQAEGERQLNGEGQKLIEPCWMAWCKVPLHPLPLSGDGEYGVRWVLIIYQGINQKIGGGVCWLYLPGRYTRPGSGVAPFPPHTRIVGV